MRTKASPRPKDHIFLDFMHGDTGFGFYWNGENSRDDEIEVILWKGINGRIEMRDPIEIPPKKIPISPVGSSYFADLFECAQYLHDNHPEILKSMSLENILANLFHEEDEVQMHYSAHFAFPKSRYVPLSDSVR